MYITIETLWKKHKNKSLIARMTGHDWKTVAKKIKEIKQGKKLQKIRNLEYQQVIYDNLKVHHFEILFSM